MPSAWNAAPAQNNANTATLGPIRVSPAEAFIASPPKEKTRAANARSRNCIATNLDGRHREESPPVKRQSMSDSSSYPDKSSPDPRRSPPGKPALRPYRLDILFYELFESV